MPRKKATTTQATRNADDSGGEDFDDVFEEADEEPAARKGKGSRRSGAAAGGGLSEQDIEKKAHDLCRLALFTEYRRQILKREDINKKVMGGNSKQFPQVLALANKELKKMIGYEIVELSTRAEREKDILGVAMETDNEPKKASSKQYILRNILDPELIRVACTPDDEIRTQEEADATMLDEDVPITGSIISWQTSDQVPSYGTLCVILSLILVSGKTVADAMLRSHMKKLRLTSTTPIDVGTMNSPKKITLEQYLTLLIKQGYLDRVKVGNIAGQKGNKRPRGGAARPDGDEGSIDFEWRWGERAHAEISEQGISDFVVEFMTERSKPDGNAQESERAKQARLEKVKRQITKDVARVAQTDLTQIREQEEA